MKKLLFYLSILFCAVTYGQVAEEGAINIAGGFKTNAPVPIDDRFIVDSLSHLDGIHNKFAGLTSFVKEAGKYYVYTNENTWNELAINAQDLPKGFVVASMTNTDIVDSLYVGVEHRFMYITDTYRYFNIDNYIPDVYGTIVSIKVVDNDIHFIYYANTDQTGNYDAFGHGVLKDCKIINNILTPTNSDYQLFVDEAGNNLIHPGSGGTVTSARIHCEDYSDGWFYYATRVPNPATGYTQIIKLNANNIHEFEIEDVFLGGGLSNIVVVDDWIYAVKQDGAAAFETGNLVRIPINNIGTYEVVTELGTDPLHKLTSQGPLQIYLGEIYIQTHRDISLSSDPNYSKSIGMQVYSLSGELLRQNENILAFPNATVGATNIHWFDIFNGKIIGHSVISAANENLRRLIRIDCNSLELEETVPVLNSSGTSVISLTDDNYISPEGKIYLANESSSGNGVDAALLNWRLIIVEDYRDFTTINNTGFYFKGTAISPTYIPRKKLNTKLSDFEDDLDYIVKSVSVNNGTPVEPDINGNVNISVSGSGGVQSVTGSSVNNADPQNPVVNALPSTGGTLTGNLLSQNINPSTSLTYSLGNTSMYWFNAYIFNVITNGVQARSGDFLKIQNSLAQRTITIFENGNVNIGSSTSGTPPSNKLNVEGSAKFSGTVDGVIPTENQHLTTKAYVDNITGTALSSNTSTHSTSYGTKVYKENGTYTVTLATTGVPNGYEFTIKNVGTGTITLAVEGGGTIDGRATKIYNVTNSGGKFTKDGNNYIVTGNF